MVIFTPEVILPSLAEWLKPIDLAYWDIDAGPAAWKSVTATHPGAAVYCLVFDQLGNLYIGGNFTDLGDANGDYICKWTGAAWVSLGTGANSRVHALAVGPDNSIYATGEFLLAGGVAGTAYVAKWNGTAWITVRYRFRRYW